MVDLGSSWYAKKDDGRAMSKLYLLNGLFNAFSLGVVIGMVISGAKLTVWMKIFMVAGCVGVALHVLSVLL